MGRALPAFASTQMRSTPKRFISPRTSCTAAMPREPMAMHAPTPMDSPSTVRNARVRFPRREERAVRTTSAALTLPPPRG